MFEKLRSRPKYRTLLNGAMPRYTVLEIGPALSLIPQAELRNSNLIVFDVGANTGVWSASLLAYNGDLVDQLHMFEPMSGNIERFRKHEADGLYGVHREKIRFNAIAVSDSVGDLTMNFNKETSGYASAAVSETLMGARAVPLSNNKPVPCMTLDKYCAEAGIERIDLLKIDVEGHEMAVLKGASALLAAKRINVIIYEFGTHQMSRREFFRDFWNFFDGFGYQMYHGRHNGWSPKRIERYTTHMEDFSQIRMMYAVAPQQVA